jgi:hypothetical protein
VDVSVVLGGDVGDCARLGGAVVFVEAEGGVCEFDPFL